MIIQEYPKYTQLWLMIIRRETALYKKQTDYSRHLTKFVLDNKMANYLCTKLSWIGMNIYLYSTRYYNATEMHPVCITCGWCIHQANDMATDARSSYVAWPSEGIVLEY